MSGSLEWQLLAYEYLISWRFQSVQVSEKGRILWGFGSGDEFGPITAGHVEQGRFKWVGYATAASKYHQIWLRRWMRQRWSL